MANFKPYDYKQSSMVVINKEWSGTLKELTAKRDKIKRLIRHHTKAHRMKKKM